MVWRTRPKWSPSLHAARPTPGRLCWCCVPVLVLEATGKSVAELLGEGPLTKEQILPIAAGCASALCELARRHLVHMDVAARNFLFQNVDGNLSSS